LKKATDEEQVTKEDSADPAQSYWKREWELSLMEGDEAGEDESEGETKEGAMDENNDPFCDFSKSTETSTVASVRGVDPPEEILSGIEKNATNEPSEYERDMEYVNKLMKMYQKQGIPDREANESSKMPQTGTEFDEAQVATEEQETLFEIENMFEVDRVYNQRQVEMARLRNAEETEEVQPIQSENRHVHSVQHKDASKTGNGDISSSHMRFLQSTKQGDRGALPTVHESEREAFRKAEMNFHFKTRHEESVEESREDESYRSERSDYGSSREQSYSNERSDYGPVRKQSYSSDYGPVREQSRRTERSDSGSMRERSTRSERSGYESRQSEDETEYADHLDHSTSQHHAFLWGHSSRGERTYPARPEALASMQSERSGYTSDVMDGIIDTERSERTLAMIRDMDGIIGTEQSEHTLAAIRESGREGRKGGTYNIKIAMSSPHHSESPTHRTRTPREKEPSTPREKEPSIRSARFVFSRQAADPRQNVRR
jgi:hypothetical protein